VTPLSTRMAYGITLKLMVCSTVLPPPEEQTVLLGIHSSAHHSTGQYSGATDGGAQALGVAQPQAACMDHDVPMDHGPLQEPPMHHQARCGAHVLHVASLAASEPAHATRCTSSGCLHLCQHCQWAQPYPADTTRCAHTRCQCKPFSRSSPLCRNHCAATCICKGLLPRGLIQHNRTCSTQKQLPKTTAALVSPDRMSIHIETP
jgi:hypothetical protein